MATAAGNLLTQPRRRSSAEYLKAAFLALEPPNCFVSLARQFGGGSITTEVQLLILEHCINNVGKGITFNSPYVKSILKKIIVAVESASEVVVDGLYEQFTHHMALQMDDNLLKERNKVSKQISFLFPDDFDDITSNIKDLVFPLRCSLNMLEGDTGCSLWPSSLFLSEFVLTNPDIFSNKSCFELGSGVGLVGISIIHIGASKVVLSDGDESTLTNMKHNLEMNHLSAETETPRQTYVECKYLQWESPSKSKLQSYQPDVVLGADIIYDPLCIPHLIEVLSILLSTKKPGPVHEDATDVNGSVFTHPGEQQSNNISFSEDKEAPIAYIAQVIRNKGTFNYFLKLAEEAHLYVVDVTEVKRPHNLLPYMLSYDQSSVQLFRISSLLN